MSKESETIGESSKPSGLAIFITLILTVTVLRYAQEIFIPIALAMLLSFILTPLIVKLCQWKFPKTLAIITTVALAFVFIGLLSGMVSLQLVRLTQNIPEYQTNIHQKIVSLKEMTPGVFYQLEKFTTAVEKESTAKDQLESTEPSDVKPIPVEIQNRQPTIIDQISLFEPLLGPFGTGILVIIFLISILFHREDLRARFITVISKGNLNLATQIIDDAALRITTYLWMNLIVNASYGITIGIGLYYIGVPNALLWGFLATFLRFIPYVGSWIAASFPLLLAIAVDPGWLKLFMVISLFGLVELVTNNIIEPFLYGASTGISSLALLIAAVFWAWLWGLVGLFLSVPLTVCLFVMGKYVPGLEFLCILLGSKPVLNQESALYQRLLAKDEEETLRISQNFVKKAPVSEYYDYLLIPALNLAEEDRHNGSLAEHRQKFILEYASELIDMIGANEESVINEEATKENESETASYTVICVPARDEADELAARMLTQLLNNEGISTFALECGALSDSSYKFLRSQKPQIICISSLPPFAVVPAHQMYRKLKRLLPKVNIIIGIWSLSADVSELKHRLGIRVPQVVSNLKDAVQMITALLKQETITSPPQNLADIPFSLEGIPSDELFDFLAKEISKTFEVPLSLVTLINRDPEFWKFLVESPNESVEKSATIQEPSIADHLSIKNEMLVLEDVHKDPNYAHNTWLQDRGIRFCVAVPLKTSSEKIVGDLCIIDTKPHVISDKDKLLLQTLANEFVRKIEHNKL